MAPEIRWKPRCLVVGNTPNTRRTVEYDAVGQSCAVVRHRLQPYLGPCYHPGGTIGTDQQLMQTTACFFYLHIHIFYPSQDCSFCTIPLA